MLLNNDTKPQKDFLKILWDDMQLDLDIGIACSTRVNNSEKFTMAMEGCDLTTGSVQCTTEDIDEVRPAVFVPFCSVLMRKEMVERIGLLDRRMRNYCSDNDYCLRAVLDGWQVIVDCKSRVIHYQSVSVHAAKADVKLWDDQKAFAYKHFGPLMNEILDIIPINYELNKYGKLGFKYEVRKQGSNLVGANGEALN